uniref:Uncharacterized protein n=1 Tax=Pithovirus LCPAC104 TaxID=2506589 RepID=A0A481Z463_9VIRU|nr:MAG: hypothetical protein LCPAC104_01970 [Pithovirus LCPAC104]
METGHKTEIAIADITNANTIEDQKFIFEMKYAT